MLSEKEKKFFEEMRKENAPLEFCYNQIYRLRFGEGFPIMVIDVESFNDLIEKIQRCLKENKKAEDIWPVIQDPEIIY